MSAISRARSSRTRWISPRGIMTGLGAAAIAVTFATPAAAAQPNNRACLGEDVRMYSQGGSSFGAFVSMLAEGGVGMEIQAHLAGLVPDSTIPNTCND